MSETRLVNVKEAASILHVSERTIRHQIEKGAMPARKIGRELRIRYSVVISFMPPDYTSADPTP
jgi:excisionase family DNA binding protein